MTHSQTQSSTVVEDKWTEIIEDLWKHLPHFQDVEDLYDDNCLKLNCVTLQFGDGEESESDSETWLQQNTSDTEDSLVEVHDTKECKCIRISGYYWLSCDNVTMLYIYNSLTLANVWCVCILATIHSMANGITSLI